MIGLIRGWNGKPSHPPLTDASIGAYTVAVFGEKGRHARTTIGVPALPGDAAVEVEGMFELE